MHKYLEQPLRKIVKEYYDTMTEPDQIELPLDCSVTCGPLLDAMSRDELIEELSNLQLDYTDVMDKLDYAELLILELKAKLYDLNVMKI